MASRDTPRGVSPVLGGVCANLLRKRSKAALSYSTPFLTLPSIPHTGNNTSTPTGVCHDKKSETGGIFFYDETGTYRCGD